MTEYSPDDRYKCTFCGKTSYTMLPYTVLQKPICCCKGCEEKFLVKKEKVTYFQGQRIQREYYDSKCSN